MKLFFPKGGTHCTDLPFRMLSSHAAPAGLLSGLCPPSLTAARQIRAFSSTLLEKRIIQNALNFEKLIHQIIIACHQKNIFDRTV